MTRTKNIKNNLTFNVVKFVTQLVLQFVLRTIMIYYMGAEYLGLNGLFTNIFAFLNLAELGIGSAVVFAMYKPIADNDIEQVKALQNLYKKFYLIISVIVLIVGLAITPFLKYLIKDGVSADINIYILYLMYLANTLVGYFSAHKRSLLFAYQRNDVENKIKTICLIGMTIIQILVLVLTKNYYLFFGVNIIFTLIECLLIHVGSNKLLPEINGKAEPVDPDTKKNITKNVMALSFHKIGGVIVGATDNLLISIFFGAVVLGAYSNYYLVTSSLISCFAVLVNAATASLGNLVASESKEYAYERFVKINAYFSMLCTFCSVCMFVLFQPFIQVWTGGGVYLLKFSTMALIVISFYLSKMRTATLMFRDAAGLYWQDRWKPIVEAVVNLVASIVLAKLIGINGIFLGTIISTVVAPLWVEPNVLYKHYFKRSSKSYFIRYLIDFVIMLAIGTICFGVCYLLPAGGIWWLMLKFVVCITLCVALICVFYCWSKEFRELLVMLKRFVVKIFKRKKSN